MPQKKRPQNYALGPFVLGFVLGLKVQFQYQMYSGSVKFKNETATDSTCSSLVSELDRSHCISSVAKPCDNRNLP